MTDTSNPDPLETLGWSAHFSTQVTLTPDDRPVRVAAVHRSRLDGFAASGPVSLSPVVSAGVYAVGDWVVATGAAASAPLERTTDITRRRPHRLYQTGGTSVSAAQCHCGQCLGRRRCQTPDPVVF